MLRADFERFLNLYEADRKGSGIPRKELYDTFLKWSDEEGHVPPLNAFTTYNSLRIAFYNAVRDNGISENIHGTQVCFQIKRKERANMENANNMNILDFIGKDIWTVSQKGGGRGLNYEVKITTQKPQGNRRGRVNITLKNHAHEMVNDYKRVYVSSFSKLGTHEKVLLKVTKDEKAYGSYSLSRSATNGDSTITQIQFAPMPIDLDVFNKWSNGFYKLHKLADDVFYIDLSDKE